MRTIYTGTSAWVITSAHTRIVSAIVVVIIIPLKTTASGIIVRRTVSLRLSVPVTIGTEVAVYRTTTPCIIDTSVVPVAIFITAKTIVAVSVLRTTITTSIIYTAIAIVAGGSSEISVAVIALETLWCIATAFITTHIGAINSYFIISEISTAG